MRALKSEPTQSDLHIGVLHEKIPQQTRAVIFDHRDDRSLVDCKIGMGEPIGVLAERIGKTKTTPKPVAEPIVKMPHGAKRRFRRIWETRQCRGWRNHAIVLIRRMPLATLHTDVPAPARASAFIVSRRVHVVPPGIVARREPPAGWSITLVIPGIPDAMFNIDPHMMRILSPVVGVDILEPTRIEAAEGIMAKEQGPAIRRAERQFDVVIKMAVQKAPALRPAIVID